MKIKNISNHHPGYFEEFNGTVKAPFTAGVLLKYFFWKVMLQQKSPENPTNQWASNLDLPR